MPEDADILPERAPRPWLPETALAVIALALVALQGLGTPVTAVIGLLAVATALAIWRWPQRWVGAPMLAWGLVGIATGLAVGVRHVLGGESDLASLAAAAALIAGGILLVAGSARLLRGLPCFGRVLGVAGIAVLALVGLYVLIIPFLATQPLQGADPGPAPDRFTAVTFETSDGVTLRGWYAESANGSGVVVVPGAGSSRESALTQAQVIADAGYGVLVYDPRGHGASEGTAMDLGWAGDLDVRAAVDELSTRPGIESIGALGLSMGGEQVIGAAAADPRIEAVVAEGATNRVAGDLVWLSSQYGTRGTFQVILERAKHAITRGLTPYPAPPPLRDSLRSIAPRPVLLITAGARDDEGFAAQYNAAGLPSVTVWDVPDAAHIAGLRTDPDAWTEQVVGFFDRNLG